LSAPNLNGEHAEILRAKLKAEATSMEPNQSRYQTPFKGTLLAGALIIPLSALLPLEIVSYLAIMAVLLSCYSAMGSFAQRR
jgi:hypothetical protein